RPGTTARRRSTDTSWPRPERIFQIAATAAPCAASAADAAAPRRCGEATTGSEPEITTLPAISPGNTPICSNRRLQVSSAMFLMRSRVERPGLREFAQIFEIGREVAVSADPVALGRAAEADREQHRLVLGIELHGIGFERGEMVVQRARPHFVGDRLAHADDVEGQRLAWCERRARHQHEMFARRRLHTMRKGVGAGDLAVVIVRPALAATI